jgi:hypothetical protein
MTDPGPDFDNWFRWGVGVCLSVFTGLFYHLNGKIDRSAEAAETKVDRNLERIWTELKDIRKGIDEDRRHAADSRANLAASIVTRDEFERQVNRLVETVDKQIAALARGRG